jgi:hypothetical protein
MINLIITLLFVHCFVPFVNSRSWRSFIHSFILSLNNSLIDFVIHLIRSFFLFLKIPLDDLLGSPSLPLPASTATAGGNGGSASGSGLSRLQPPDSDSESDTKTSDYHRRLKHVQVPADTVCSPFYNFV